MPRFFILQKRSGLASVVFFSGLENDYSSVRLIDVAEYEEPLNNWISPGVPTPFGQFIEWDELPKEVRAYPELSVFNPDRHITDGNFIFELGAAT